MFLRVRQQPFWGGFICSKPPPPGYRLSPIQDIQKGSSICRVTEAISPGSLSLPLMSINISVLIINLQNKNSFLIQRFFKLI